MRMAAKSGSLAQEKILGVLSNSIKDYDLGTLTEESEDNPYRSSGGVSEKIIINKIEGEEATNIG